MYGWLQRRLLFRAPLGRRSALALAAVLAAFAAGDRFACADSLANFYKGNEITLIVGANRGGGYDLLARFAARHLGAFIPGHPIIVVEDMPGADSEIMSDYIFNAAPQDGTVIGLVQRGVLISDLIGEPDAHYKAAKFNWLGNMSSETSVVVSWAASPVKTFHDLFTRGLVVGGTGDSQSSADALNALLGTKIKVIPGYPGSADVILAMERGEVQGMVGLSWSEMKVKNRTLLAQHKLNLLVQDDLVGSPELPGVPVVYNYVHGALKRRAAQIFYELKRIARPLMTGPRVPSDRVAALRRAFAEMTADPGFKADARRERLTLAPSTYQSVNRFIATADSAPGDVVAELTAIASLSR